MRRSDTSSGSVAAGISAVLLASDPGMAFAAARCLRFAGMRFRLLGAARYPAVRTMLVCRGATRVTMGPTRSEPGTALEQLQAALAESPDAVAVPAGLAATFYLARHATALPASQVFPLSPEPLLQQVHGKWEFSALCRSLGVRHPRTALVERAEDLRDLPLELPVVVKPLEAEGSRGVRVVHDRATLTRLVDRVAGAGLLPVLLQEFVAGDDMGVSVVADHGRVVACRLQSPAEGGRLDYLDRPDALELARTLVAGTDYHGVANIDLRCSAADDQLYALEWNPRLYATSHQSCYAGMNPVALGISLARSQPLTLDLLRATDVLRPGTAARRLLRREPVSLASRWAAEAELREPLSSGVRALEWRFPELFRRLRGEERNVWDVLADQVDAEEPAPALASSR
ncbi:MAG: ATP-grasp domain-containing protein [Pseudonocardiaceae bacterium]